MLRGRKETTKNHEYPAPVRSHLNITPEPEPAEEEAPGRRFPQHRAPSGRDNTLLVRARDWQSIGSVLLLYIQEFSHRTKATRYHVEEALYNFMDVVGLTEHSPMNLIDKTACKTWKQAMLSGQANRTPGTRLPKAATIARKLQMLKHFCKWSVANEYLDTNPMEGLDLPARLVSSVKQRKEGFTDAELATIFHALSEDKHYNTRSLELYWLSMCLMCSGARCAEMTQLLKTDVRTIDGVLCFDLCVGEGKSLKNRMSARLVPVHPQLLDAGFKVWFDKQPGPRVFPTLYEKGSPSISKLFTDILIRCKIKRPAVSLHSLRHTMTIKLERARTGACQ